MKSVYYSLVNFVADYCVGGSQLKMEIAIKVTTAVLLKY